MYTPNLFIYTAFPCEAKPLIDRFKLKKDTTVQAFGVFRNDQIILTVTGMGKCAMAAGVAYSQALFQHAANPIMVNVGIAGHQNEIVGNILLADKITDMDNGRSFYPPLVFTPPCPTAPLETYARPQISYPESALCDMEASAFYETAVHFSSGELIQTLKIVSDNAEHHPDKVNPQMVSELIDKQLPMIIHVIEKLSDLAKIVANDTFTGFDSILKRYHLTVSQQIQLRKQLSRWQVLTGNSKLEMMEKPAQNGAEFLSMLENRLRAIEFSL